MSDMLRIAKADIMIATNILKTDGMQDEVYLNIAGYHCSQAAEKVIKHFILENGVVPPKVHKISELINYMDNRNMKSDVFDELDLISLLLDSWISETRYVVNSIATQKKVDNAINVISEVIKQLDNPETMMLDSVQEELVNELKINVKPFNDTTDKN